jgi:hypothetical protein
LLSGWKAQGWSLGPVNQLRDGVEPLSLPRCETGLGTIDGRTGMVFMQGNEFLGDADGEGQEL